MLLQFYFFSVILILLQLKKYSKYLKTKQNPSFWLYQLPK